MLNTRVLCEYPIKYLQDKLRGICTGDLVIFGASSGSGKSTLSRLITRAAYNQNCPVVLYSLENSPGTFVSEDVRMLYNEETGSRIEQRAWEIIHTKDPKRYEEYRQRVFERHQRTNEDGLKLLQIHEEVADLNMTVDRLVKSMIKKYDEGYRLFIIDHLDMLISDPRNELSQTVYNMNKLWWFVSTYNVGCVAFSQTTDLPENILCPNDTFLRGSRTKGQRATVVIMLAQHKYNYYLDGGFGTCPTYMRIAKFRQGGTSCAIVYYRDGEYIDKYKEVLCDYSGKLIDGMTVDKFIKMGKTND